MPAVAYPLLAHAATITGNSRLTLASVVALVLAVLMPALLQGRAAAWAAAAACGAGIFMLARLDAAALVLYLPPVLLNFFLAWLFGHTLRAGRLSLIERLVRLLHDPDEELDPAIDRYARRLTATWTALFIVLGSINLVLALLATPGGLLEVAGFDAGATVPRDVWSLFANLVNYLIVGAFFCAEWLYRRRRFPQQTYRSLFDFLQRAAAAGPALLASLRAERGRVDG